MKQLMNLIITAALLTGCASVSEKNPHDPYERYNRTMFKFNDKADQYVMQPVARGYQKITPQIVQKGVSNFFDNLRDVVSLGSNVLRGDLNRAGTDLVRVTVNSTVGLGGVINIADKEKIPNNKNTLGDTLASWGWKKSHYFVFPFTGPSTVRDSVGDVLTYGVPLEKAMIHDKTARRVLTGVKLIDNRVKYLPATDMIEKAQPLDKYSYTRDVFMAFRRQQLGLQPPKNEEDADIEDLMGDDNVTETSQAFPHRPVPVVMTQEAEAAGGQPGGVKGKVKQHWLPTESTVLSGSESAGEISPFARQIWTYRLAE